MQTHLVEFVAMLRSWVLKEVPVEDYGIPSDGTFWVETDDEESGSTVTLANNGEGYGFFFSTFQFDADGKYFSHGSWE